MTVNELIEALSQIKEEGGGDLDVFAGYWDSYDPDVDTVDFVDPYGGNGVKLT